MASSRTLRVFLVDEHDFVRSSLNLLIENVPEMEVVGEAADGSTAIEIIGDLLPDVVLMDLNMPGMDGLTATRLICEKYPHIRVVVLTASILEGDGQAAAQAGASAYLRKDASINEIVTALRGGG